MSIEQSIRCDICGRQKGEANKWFSCAGATMRPVAFNAKAKRHFCSEECFHKMVSRELQRVREGEAQND